jgi:hypothetical protein
VHATEVHDIPVEGLSGPTIGAAASPGLAIFGDGRVASHWYAGHFDVHEQSGPLRPGVVGVRGRLEAPRELWREALAAESVDGRCVSALLLYGCSRGLWRRAGSPRPAPSTSTAWRSRHAGAGLPHPQRASASATSSRRSPRGSVMAACASANRGRGRALVCRSGAGRCGGGCRARARASNDELPAWVMDSAAPSAGPQPGMTFALAAGEPLAHVRVVTRRRSRR